MAYQRQRPVLQRLFEVVRSPRPEQAALIAAVFYAGYLLVMTQARESIDALAAITCMSVAAAAVLGLYAFAMGDPFVGFPTRSWLAIGAAAWIVNAR